MKPKLAIFDDYDERSIIENCLFKEAKQGWHIEHAPQKTFQALAVHVFFTVVVFALVNAYRDYQREQDAASEKEAEAYGIQRWREAQRREARDKGIVIN